MVSSRKSVDLKSHRYIPFSKLIKFSNETARPECPPKLQAKADVSKDRFRKRAHAGFTVIEAMVAIAIIALSLGSLFTLQTTIFTRLGQAYMRVSRFFIAKNMLMEEVVDQEGPVSSVREEQIKDPKTKLTLTGKKVEDPAFKQFPHLQRIQVTSEWATMVGKQREILVSFVYRPPEEKKESDKEQLQEEEPVKGDKEQEKKEGEQKPPTTEEKDRSPSPEKEKQKPVKGSR